MLEFFPHLYHFWRKKNAEFFGEWKLLVHLEGRIEGNQTDSQNDKI